MYDDIRNGFSCVASLCGGFVQHRTDTPLMHATTTHNICHAPGGGIVSDGIYMRGYGGRIRGGEGGEQKQ